MHRLNVRAWLKSAISRLLRWKYPLGSISPKLELVRKSPPIATLSVEQRRQRAVPAQQLLENPLLQEAFGAVEADLLQQMRSVRLDDKEGHTRLVMALQTCHSMTRHLWLIIQDGQATQFNIRGSRID
jgi:hypothetical protein